MTDIYQQLVNTPIGGLVAKQVGLPNAPRLVRHRPGQPVIDGPVLLGAAPDSRLAGSVTEILASVQAEAMTPMDEQLRTAAAEAKLNAGIWNPEAGGEQRFRALIFDATGIRSSGQLEAAWAFLHPSIRGVTANGRVIILGTPPEDCSAPPEAIAQRALEGLERAIGKEVRKGATSQLVYVRPGAERELESTLRFFLSPKSAFVSGQVVRIAEPVAGAAGPPDWERPLAAKTALVTGAARGIGAAIAQVLARDGAHVVGLDIPAMSQELTAGMAEIGGSVLTADITEDSAPAAIANHLLEFHQGVDVVVHNAGVTRDKTLGRMSQERWNTVMAINLTAPQRIDKELFERQAVRENGRIVCVSSISGIAGNAGQTNYSTSKAGVIGIVQEFAPQLRERGVTINAVAPGFIETQMTAAMPLAVREAGRRMNSLSQGGLPVDVAETVAWYASPGSGGVTGNVVRVCGQSLIGA
ncbi:MAG: 3-oxoacyl-ACP reductase [Actinomycetota bacterium]|nr:3-oxoacyl-ACP reductase [Actinomycetota bacterium]